MKNNSHVFRYSPHCLLVRRRVTSGFHPPRISPGAARHKNSVDSTSHFVDRIQSSGLSPIACIVLGLGRGRTVDQKGQKPFSQTGTSGVPSGAHCLHYSFSAPYTGVSRSCIFYRNCLHVYTLWSGDVSDTSARIGPDADAGGSLHIRDFLYERYGALLCYF